MKHKNALVFVLVALAVFVLYNGFQDNYYFSDDYQWVSHAILVDDSLSEIFLVRGRDFNPLLTLFFWIVIKIGGLSPLLLRTICFFSFSGALYAFYYILVRYFEVNRVTALGAALMCGFNVYISEVLLYISTFVYAVTLLLFFIAVKFFWDGKKIRYLVLILLAFQVKETIILAVLPLLLYEKKWENKIFLGVSSVLIFLTRFLFQAGDTGSYTHFASTENIFYKIYFLILHPMNLSPFVMSLSLGIGIIAIVGVIFIYYFRAADTKKSIPSFEKKDKTLFFLSFFAVYVLFFAFLPRLSSKYYFYPTFAFWGSAALLGSYFYKRSRNTKYFIFALLGFSLIFNYPAVKREIEDYKILGDFSRRFIAEQAKIIKNKVDFKNPLPELLIERGGDRQLRRVYREIYERRSILKLLPVREHSVGGLLLPDNLVPIVFYPKKIVRWKSIKETSAYFLGRLERSMK